MALSYSIYEAKARVFPRSFGKCREGKTVTVSYRGEPVAEIRAIAQRQKPTARRATEGPRTQRLPLIRSAIPRRTFRPVERRPGALSRFLAERGG